MRKLIHINKTFFNKAKEAARRENRSISGQVEFWAALGKCALDNPDLPIKFVKELLIIKRQK